MGESERAEGISWHLRRCLRVRRHDLQLHRWHVFSGCSQTGGEQNFYGKILIDVSNPLDFSKGFPPALAVCNTDSLGEQIQRAFPNAKVVKTLNTVNCNVMVNPSLVPGDHDIFMSGNDATVKAKVREVLTEWFGWKSVVNLGDISTARGVEMYLPLWVRLFGAYQNPNFNLKVVR